MLICYYRKSYNATVVQSPMMRFPKMTDTKQSFLKMHRTAILVLVLVIAAGVVATLVFNYRAVTKLPGRTINVVAAYEYDGHRYAVMVNSHKVQKIVRVDDLKGLRVDDQVVVSFDGLKRVCSAD